MVLYTKTLRVKGMVPPPQKTTTTTSTQPLWQCPLPLHREWPLLGMLFRVLQRMVNQVIQNGQHIEGVEGANIFVATGAKSFCSSSVTCEIVLCAQHFWQL